MNDRQAVIDAIHEAFDHNQYPGDGFLQGSFEGCEPNEEIAPFKGREDWSHIDAELLDVHGIALSFFSEAGLRFFLPAYLLADLRGELATADPLFVLTHGFSDFSVNHQIGARVFVRKGGKSAFVNPRRYGGMTFYDYARYRLSVFTREEAQAIVAYLRYRRDSDPDDLHRAEIDAALDLFWLERAGDAPLAASLEQYLNTEQEYLAALAEKTS